MAENIGETYSNANPLQKKHYIGLFFSKFIVEKGKIVEWELSELVKPLVEEGSVRVRSNWLLRQDSNLDQVINSHLRYHYATENHLLNFAF